MEVVDFECEFESAMKKSHEYVTVSIIGVSFIITDKYTIFAVNGWYFADFYYQNRLIAGTWLDNIVTVKPWRDIK